MITTREKKDTVVCWREIGSFFVVAGNFHYDRKKKRYITTGKKKIQSSVWRVRYQLRLEKKKDTGGEFSLRPEKKKVPDEKKDTLRPEKKRYSRLSDGCAVLAIMTGKKRYSHRSGGLCCCIVSVFGSGGKLVVFLLCQEIFITTGKKKDTVVYLASFEH